MSRGPLSVMIRGSKFGVSRSAVGLFLLGLVHGLHLVWVEHPEMTSRMLWMSFPGRRAAHVLELVGGVGLFWLACETAE